jgi:hypothetical protein
MKMRTANLHFDFITNVLYFEADSIFKSLFYIRSDFNLRQARWSYRGVYSLIYKQKSANFAVVITIRFVRTTLHRSDCFIQMYQLWGRSWYNNFDRGLFYLLEIRLTTGVIIGWQGMLIPPNPTSGISKGFSLLYSLICASNRILFITVYYNAISFICRLHMSRWTWNKISYRVFLICLVPTYLIECKIHTMTI